MGLPWLGLCWLVLGDTKKAHFYLDWTDQVRQDILLPEAYVPMGEGKKKKFEVCEHNPLGWSHALALILRQQLNALGQGQKPQETAAALAADDVRPPYTDTLITTPP
jgi:hypothetical protein